MDSIIELDVEMPSDRNAARSPAPETKPVRNKIMPPDESIGFGPEDIMEIPLLVRHESLNVGRRQGRNRPARSRSMEHRNEKPTTRHHHKKNRCYDFYDKGYCMRGDKCRYDHGQHPVVLNDFNFFGELQSSGISSFNQGSCVSFAGNPERRDVVSSSSNLVSPPGVMPEIPFDVPVSRVLPSKIYPKDQTSSYHPYSKVFSKSYSKSASLGKEEKQPVKKDSLLRTLLDVHRRRTDLYKEQVDQQRLLLQKMQRIEDSETKGKYLKLIKKNNELLKTLKSEIEFLSQDIIAMGSKQEEESKKKDSVMMNEECSPAVYELLKQEDLPSNSAKA